MLKPINSVFGLLAPLALIFLLLYSSCDEEQPHTYLEITEFQPDIPMGGRATVIKRRPGAPQTFLAGAETGGLFKSTDSGQSWKAIENVPTFDIRDIQWLSANVVFMAGGSFRGGHNNNHKVNNSCVWKSTNAGNTWFRMAGSIPPPSNRCRTRPASYSLTKVMVKGLGPTRIIAATDCGLSYTDDGGNTWTHTQLDVSVPTKGDSSSNRAIAIEARTGQKVYASSAEGVFYSDDAGSTWNGPATAPNGFMWGSHAIAISPLQADHAWVVRGGNRLWQTTNGGTSWTEDLSITSFIGGRPGFVIASTASQGKFDLYYGSGVQMYRRNYNENITSISTNGNWAQRNCDHSDPVHLEFHEDGKDPAILGTDGGLHTTTNGGNNWVLTGNGPGGGYNALQITEIKGTIVKGNNPHTDLYFSTQDNWNFASSNGGTTWPGNVKAEGFFITVPRKSTNHNGVKVSGVSCWTCRGYLSDVHFPIDNPSNFSNAPDGDTQADDPDSRQFQIMGGGFIQWVKDDDSSPNQWTLMWSSNFGSTWNAKVTINRQPRWHPKMAGPNTNPIIYQPVLRPGLTANGLEQVGLIRITDFFSANPKVESADNGQVHLGIFPTMFAWYQVFGVRPTDGAVLVAPDIESNFMKVSRDSGNTWQNDTILTNLVTAKGNYTFGNTRFPAATCIEFDPDAACQVLVGTHDRGIIRSLDGAKTWKRIALSEKVPHVSGFFFLEEDSVIVSSYGRGLWMMSMDKRPKTCAPKFPPIGPIIYDGPIGIYTNGSVFEIDRSNPKPICPDCYWAVVKNGRISKIETTRGRISKVSVTDGELIFRKDKGWTDPLPFDFGRQKAIQTSKSYPILTERRKDGRTVRGLLMEGNTIKGYVLAKGQLEWFDDEASPIVTAYPMRPEGAGYSLVRGGNIRISGTGFYFNPTARSVVKVSIPKLAISKAVSVGRDGGFKFSMPVDGDIGDYEVLALQRSNTGLLTAKAEFRVVVKESRD